MKSLRRLNEEAYNLAAEFQAHPAYKCLPGFYTEALDALFDASQDVHLAHDRILDFGDEDGEGGIDGRAWDIEVGDVVLEDGGGDAFIVTALDTHGDAVLITADCGDGITTQRTLDGDDGITYWRED